MNSKKLKERIADLEMLNLELLEAIQILSLKVDHLRDDIEDQNSSVEDLPIKVVVYTKAEYEQEELINKLMAEWKAKGLDPYATKEDWHNRATGYIAGNESNTLFGADTIAVVTQDDALSVAVSEGVLTLSSSTLSNPAVVESLSDVADVDTTTKINGSVLVYRTTTNKWTSTTTLDAQNMEGGEF